METENLKVVRKLILKAVVKIGQGAKLKLSEDNVYELTILDDLKQKILPYKKKEVYDKKMLSKSLEFLYLSLVKVGKLIRFHEYKEILSDEKYFNHFTMII